MWEDGGSEKLLKVVRLNEGAKQILRRSIGVNLLALDAIVQSRKAGDALRGFDEVSKQMRRWTAQLEAEVALLVNASVGSVLTVSSLVKLTAQHRLMEAAAAQSPSAAKALEDTLRTFNARWVEIDMTFTRQRRHIHFLFDNLSQLGLMACVLSRSAMIEAAYGDSSMREALSHVSQEFTASADHVVTTINTLRKTLGDSRP